MYAKRGQKEEVYDQKHKKIPPGRVTDGITRKRLFLFARFRAGFT